MIQILLEQVRLSYALVAPCVSIPFKQIMLSSLIMLIEAYEELHNQLAVLLLIPKLASVEGMTDMHYMPFEGAVAYPFTAEH